MNQLHCKSVVVGVDGSQGAISAAKYGAIDEAISLAHCRCVLSTSSRAQRRVARNPPTGRSSAAKWHFARPMAPCTAPGKAGRDRNSASFRRSRAGVDQRMTGCRPGVPGHRQTRMGERRAVGAHRSRFGGAGALPGGHHPKRFRRTAEARRCDCRRAQRRTRQRRSRAPRHGRRTAAQSHCATDRSAIERLGPALSRRPRRARRRRRRRRVTENHSSAIDLAVVGQADANGDRRTRRSATAIRFRAIRIARYCWSATESPKKPSMEFVTPRSIVVGIDGSKAATRAAYWAVDEAVRRDVPLRLLYAIERTTPRKPRRSTWRTNLYRRIRPPPR